MSGVGGGGLRCCVSYLVACLLLSSWPGSYKLLCLDHSLPSLMMMIALSTDHKHPLNPET